MGPETGALTALLRAVAAAPSAELEDAPLPPGTVIGRFELRRELGRGGFGVVWEAKDQALGRLVAFKLVRPGSLEGSAGQVAREAEVVARLQHPNLVTLFDVGQSEHGPYLILELLRGETLQARLDRGPLRVAEAVGIAVEVARGLAYAHGEGVVHRDLKPSNVFLTERGPVKLLDFGMAHVFGRRRVSGGTPAFMAPEQWEDSPEDERTDVFALGVMVHRMVTGNFPFPEDGGRWSSGPAEAERLEVEGVPSLGELVARMLAKAPRDRPRDGAEVLVALEGIQRALPAAASDGSRAVRVRGRGPGASRNGSGRGRRWALFRVGAPLVLLLVIALVAAWPRFGRDALGLRGERRVEVGGGVGVGVGAGTGAAAALTPTIAVLPFADMSPGKDQEYLSDGLAEEILNVLAQVEGLRVTARTSSFSFKGKPATISEIGQALHVDTLLEGSVRRSGNRIRVTAQVIKAADGFHLWSKTFDRDLADVFVVQDEIAKAVVAALKVTLLARKGPATRERRSANPEAYTQYLLAREIYRRDDNAAGHRRALATFQRAVALDPDYAPAWAGVARASLAAAITSTTPVEKAAHLSRTEEAVEKALTLAPDLAEAYAIRGSLRSLNLDWSASKADLDRALALSPNDSLVLLRHGQVFTARDQIAEAIREKRKATELDPLWARAWALLAHDYVTAGELDAGRMAVLRALEIDPRFNLAIDTLGSIELLAGRTAAALEACDRLADPDEREYARLWTLAAAPGPNGFEGESRAALNQLLAKLGGAGSGSELSMAEIYAMRGEPDRAFVWLERARTEKDQGLSSIRINPFLRPLQKDPRFAAFVRSIGLPE